MKWGKQPSYTFRQFHTFRQHFGDKLPDRNHSEEMWINQSPLWSPSKYLCVITSIWHHEEEAAVFIAMTTINRVLISPPTSVPFSQGAWMIMFVSTCILQGKHRAHAWDEFPTTSPSPLKNVTVTGSWKAKSRRLTHDSWPLTLSIIQSTCNKTRIFQSCTQYHTCISSKACWLQMSPKSCGPVTRKDTFGGSIAGQRSVTVDSGPITR